VVQEPKLKGFDVRMFLSLVQAGGYNPLTVRVCLMKCPIEEGEKEEGNNTCRVAFVVVVVCCDVGCCC
jgi:hypothetical protein